MYIIYFRTFLTAAIVLTWLISIIIGGIENPLFILWHFEKSTENATIALVFTILERINIVIIHICI